MREKIDEMVKNNIGSLCLFLKNPKNREFLEYLESNIVRESLVRPISEKIYYFVNNIIDAQLCDCGEHLSFIGFKSGYRSTRRGEKFKKSVGV